MRKAALAALLAALLLFSGCHKSDAKEPADAAALYTGARVEAEAQISVLADYPADYGVRVHWGTDGASAEITAPADVAGIKATLSGGSTEISYDGAVLEAFLPSLPGYAPVDAIPALMEDISKIEPDDWSRDDYEGEAAMVLTFRDDASAVSGIRRVWLRESDLSFLGAELFLDDSLVIRIRCTSFTLYPAE